MNANDIATRADLARVEAKQDRIIAMLEAVQIAPRGVWKTYTEAAAMLGVSVSTIARRVRDGELQAEGRGKLRRVLVEI